VNHNNVQRYYTITLLLSALPVSTMSAPGTPDPAAAPGYSGLAYNSELPRKSGRHDRILEHAVLSKHVHQCDVFLIAENNTCRHNVLPAVVTNMRMTTDDGASDTGCTRDDLCIKFEVLQCS
jgi:hypothetical protein